jgi:hypothetical protein
MPQNRPPAGYGRIDLTNEPRPTDYTLPDDEEVDEQTGGRVTPPPVLVVNPETPPDGSGMVLVRGGIPWPQEPAMAEAFNAAGMPGRCEAVDPPEGEPFKPYSFANKLTPLASTLTGDEAANLRGALTSLRNQPPPGGVEEPPAWCNPTAEEMSPWPAMVVGRGGLSRSNRPTTPPEPPEEVEEPTRWIAPTTVLGIDGEPLPDAPAPPPLRPIDHLTQAVEQTFGIQTEKELDPEPARPDGKELGDWWHRVADSDLEMLLPKAVEYSAHDLRMTGHVMADLMGIKVDDAFAAELACAVYLMSKVTRILGAYKDGRLPSSDSLTDSRVYATMMARIREKGSWPGWDVGRDTTSQ